MAEWQASDYAKQSTLQQVMAEEQLARLVLKGDERILDVGCGDGKITAEIAAKVPGGSVLGTDPSKDMIAFASTHLGAPKVANLRFEVADARSLPYRAEFDLAVSFNALHWVPEQAAALAAIHAALKPGGRAWLRMVPAGPRESLEDVIESVRKEPRWASHFAGFRQPYIHIPTDEYRRLAEAAGFRVTRVHVEDKAWDFKTRAGFSAFAHATFVEWTQHIPKTEWDAFITEVLDRYQKVAASNPAEASTFKFYQMEVELGR